MSNKVHVRRDDEVIVISGNDKGKRGKILEVSPDERKVIINGVNIVSRHVKPRKQGEAGGIIKVEGAMYADKVMHYCSKCSKGVRVKAGTDSKGKKIKVCAKCGAAL